MDAQHIVGVHALHLNTVLFPLIRLVIQRKRKRLNKRLETEESRRAALGVCLGHPVLRAFGESLCEDMLKHAYRRSALANESVIFVNELPQTAGILVCVSGSLKSRRQCLFTGSDSEPPAPDHSRPAGADYSSVMGATEKEVRGFRQFDVRRGVPIIVESELNSPNVIGCERVLQDVGSTEQLTATSPCDLWVIPFDVFHSRLPLVAITRRNILREYRLRSCNPIFPLDERHFRQSWFLSALPDAVRSALCARMTPWVLMPGECLTTKGSPFAGLFILRRGTVRLQELNEEVSGFLVVGERGAVFGEPYGTTIEAVTCCDVWTISTADITHQAIIPPAAKETLTMAGSQVHEHWVRCQLKNTARRDEFNKFLFRALRQIPYIEHAPDSVLDELAEAAHPRIYTPRSVLASTSERCGHVVVIGKGTCTVQVHGDQPRVFGRGSSLGWECLVKHRWMQPVCTTAMVEAWVVPRRALIATLKRCGMLEAATQICKAHLKRSAGVAALQLVTSDGLHASPNRQAASVLDVRPFIMHPSDGSVGYGREDEVVYIREQNKGPTYVFNSRPPRRTSHVVAVAEAYGASSPTPPLAIQASSVLSSSTECAPEDEGRLVHVHPFLYACVSNAEWIGDRSQWMACLLGRVFRSFGYLSLSSPLPGTMVPTAARPHSPAARMMAPRKDPRPEKPPPPRREAIGAGSPRQGRNMRFSYAPPLPPLTAKGEAPSKVPMPPTLVGDDGSLIDGILAGAADLRLDERRGVVADGDVCEMSEEDWRVAVEGPRTRLPVPKPPPAARTAETVESRPAPVVEAINAESPSFIQEYDASLLRAQQRTLLRSSPASPRTPQKPRSSHAASPPAQTPPGLPFLRTSRPHSSSKMNYIGRTSHLILPSSM